MEPSPALLVVKDRLLTFATFCVYGLLLAGGAFFSWPISTAEPRPFLAGVATLLLIPLALGNLRWVICGTPRLVATAQGVTVRGMFVLFFFPWRDIEKIDESAVTVRFVTTPVVRLGLRQGSRAFSSWTRLFEHTSDHEVQFPIALRGTGRKVADIVAALRRLHVQFALQVPTQSAS